MAIQKSEPQSLITVPDIESGEYQELLQENFGDSIQPVFLRVRIPGSGGLRFITASEEGEDTLEEIQGVVVLHHEARAYWPGSFSGSEPPSCASLDGKTGIGSPGGDCYKCPYAQWGSDPKGGRGQACKDMRRLYILRPGEFLPRLLTLPPTSMTSKAGSFAEYATILFNSATPMRSVLTSFRLAAERNADGISYARVVVKRAGKLSAIDAGKVRRYIASLEKYIRMVQIAPDEYIQDTGTTQQPYINGQPAQASQEPDVSAIMDSMDTEMPEQNNLAF